MSRTACLAQIRASAPAVLPSLLLCDFGNLQREVERLETAGVSAYHLDVMDGQFVPNLTYGMPIVEAMRRLTRQPLDVHLMVARPERYLREFQQAGADILTVHAEALEAPRETLQAIRELDMAAGLAVNPATPLDVVESCLDLCDMVLIMSVPAGFGGQKFDPAALDRVRRIRAAAGADLLLEMDGGINASTIADCSAAGAQLFVVGSGIFRTRDYTVAVRNLTQLALSGKR
ncbi:MAG: ribulose-phosphate 3-epimerase [Pirellulales bacterium]